MTTTDALLVLEDGTTFRGRGFGATGTVFGEEADEAEPCG